MTVPSREQDEFDPFPQFPVISSLPFSPLFYTYSAKTAKTQFNF